jgi:hypothetical protein
MKAFNKSLLIALIFLVWTSPCSNQTVTGVEDLVFGDIFPGVPKTVSKKSSGAAEFTVTGTVDTEVSLDFTLPQYLYMTGANMPVFFYNTDCQIDTTSTGNQASPTYDNLNPNQTLTYSLGPNGKLTVWLGGQVVPGLVQKSGSYTATIRLTSAYTGD